MSTRKELFVKHQGQTTPYSMALDIEKAEGSFLWDKDGKRYLDLVAGVSACTLGHCHPAIVDAVKIQAEKYMHVMVYGEFIQDPQIELALAYADHLPDSLNCTYFVNSGVEAIEAAMKLAKRATGRTEMVSCLSSYHGSTQGALSIMGSDLQKSKYRPLLPQCKQIIYNDESSLSIINESTAGVVIEPIQGASGFLVPSHHFLEKVKARCEEVGALLIFDEIQTCYGRTGKMFGFEYFDVIPDILCLAKGMGGGMPIGAFIASTELMHLLKENPTLGHITTFGGHPVSCAASLATWKVLKSTDIIDKVPLKEKIFRQKLVHPLINCINGLGLMLSIDVVSDDVCNRLVDKLMEKGLISFFFLFRTDAVRLSPPLTISEEEIYWACEQILTSLDEIQEEIAL